MKTRSIDIIKWALSFNSKPQAAVGVLAIVVEALLNDPNGKEKFESEIREFKEAA